MTGGGSWGAGVHRAEVKALAYQRDKADRYADDLICWEDDRNGPEFPICPTSVIVLREVIEENAPR